MAFTKEQLESARLAGAIIIANEGRHGRPDEWHPVGDSEQKPRYSCEDREYAIVWLAGVNDDRKWSAPEHDEAAEKRRVEAAFEYRRAVLEAAEQCGIDTAGLMPVDIVAALVSA